jgi:SAM-dependent methyltransferase
VAEARAVPADVAVAENVYGSRKRIEWIVRHLRRSDVILEVGCGTGYMICRPLAKLGYDVHGIDIDKASVEHGQALLRDEGVDPSILAARPLSETDLAPDVLIASEVLEHLRDAELDDLLGEMRQRLAPGGMLLVTVPNGYGWFELEQFFWWRAGIGPLLFRAGLCHLVEKTKSQWLGPDAVAAGPPSTLSSSPHVQRFTLRAIARRLSASGFEAVDRRGSVVFSGPFSNLLFAGVGPVLAANARWGDRLGPLASGFMLACRRRPEALA